MRIKQFLIAPTVMVACAMTMTAAAAQISFAPDSGRSAPAMRMQFIELAQSQMRAPKKKAGGRAERGKPAAMTPACPKGQFWSAAQKACLSGPAATPIQLPQPR
jgi:hypothetical protein